jgi:hypothetical protein
VGELTAFAEDLVGFWRILDRGSSGLFSLFVICIIIWACGVIDTLVRRK